MFVAYFCDAMLLIAHARACTTYGGNLLHAWQGLHMQHVTKCQFRNACSISTMLQRYIINMTVVFTIVVSTARSITGLRDNLKRTARLILMARSCHKKFLLNFLCVGILPDAICRHPSSSCFFSHHYIAIKNFAQASGSN